MRLRIVTLLALLSLVLAVFAAAQQSAYAVLAQARARKSAGDLEAAIKGFERVTTEMASDRNAAANAFLELGDIYEFLGQDARANTSYQRVVDSYADQTAERRTAADRIAGLAARKQSRQRVEIKTPFTEDPFSFAISPDGRTLVIQVTGVDGRSQLWLQPVDPSRAPQPISGTEGAGNAALPFFSPDGRSIGFFRNQKLWRIGIDGGTAMELAAAPSPSGGSWNASGVILFSGRRGVLEQVSDTGRALGSLERLGGTAESAFPRFLPDGLHFLFYSANINGGGAVRLGVLNGSLQGTAANAQGETFAPPNYILFAANGALKAQTLNLDTMQMEGSAFDLAPEVGVRLSSPGLAAVSAASATGAVAYRARVALPRQMVWLNRRGERIGRLGEPDADEPTSPRVSPDGKSVVFHRASGSNLGSIWLLNSEGGLAGQVRNRALSAVWSPDQKHLGLATVRDATGMTDLYDQPVNSPAGEGRFFRDSSGQPLSIQDWSSTGFLLASRRSNSGDLIATALEGGGFIPVATTPAVERNGRFAPDGKWVAYESNQSGRNEIYVQPFPGDITSRQRVSLSGGTSPQWGRSGKELYFLSLDNRLMAAPVFNGGSQSIEFSTPAALFPKPLLQGAEFDVTADGERFLVVESVGEAPPIYVLSNWAPKK